MTAGNPDRLRWGQAGVYVVLTLLVWGLFAFDQGLWQDDAANLARVAASGEGFLSRLFHPIGTPTRLLLGAPYALALASGAPLLVLQLLGVLAWLGIGLAAHVLARRLFPGSREIPFTAGALTLAASSDFLTASIVALGYDIAILALLAAAICLVDGTERRSPTRLAAACLLLSIALWTVDALAPPALLLPGLLLLHPEGRPRRRLAIAAAAWYAAMLPFLVVLASVLLDPSQYLAEAILPLPWIVRGLRLGKLFLYNFAPWMWAFLRRTWFPAPAPVLPAIARGVLALVAVLLFVGRFRATRGSGDAGGAPSSGTRRRWAAAAGACLVLALAANAALASVQFADVCYRTHLLSRVWASMAVAAGAVALAAAHPRLRILAWLVPALFVGLGVLSGLERQSYFLGYTRKHRIELRSILEAVPALRPGAGLILRVPPGTPPIRATHVTYLARAWTGLLYGRTDIPVFVLDEENGARCRSANAWFVCTAGNRRGRATFPWARLVVLTFSKETGRYHLEPELPAPLASGGPTGAYRPAAQIVPAPISPLARELLERQTVLSRLFP